MSKAATAIGTTPLMLAAASGNAEAVKTLVDERRRRRTPRKRRCGQTPLMFAAASNRVDAIKALLKAGADVKATSKVEQRRQPERRRAGIPRRGIGQRQPGRRQRPGPRRPGRRARRHGAGGGAAAPAAAAAAVAAARGGPAAASAGVDRAVLLQRAGRHAGRLTPLLLAARRATSTRSRRCSRAAPTSTRSAPATRPARC